MKKIFLLTLIFAASVGFAEKITLQKSATAGTKRVKTSENTQVFTNVITEIELEQLTLQGQNFTTLQLPGYVYHGEVGHPKLPAKTQLLNVPTGAAVEVKILSSEYTDFNLSEKGFKNQLFPVQPSVRKINNPDEQPLKKNRAAYRQKSFNTRSLVDVENLGIAKDQQLAQLNICPIQYLPSENVIRVYHFIEFEVNYVGGKPQSKDLAPTAKPVVYQIISDRMFENTLVPFIQWKTEKGFDVRVAYTDETAVGKTTTSIKNYLTDIYGNRETRADYLLLVGDVAQIPAFSASFSGDNYVTDLRYAEYTGDNMNDVFFGRLSATTTAQLENQIEKILAMEKLEIPSTNFLKKSLLIAGLDYNGSPNNTLLNANVNYTARYYCNSANGIDSTVYLSPASQNKSASIIADINSGYGFINYTAHGDVTEWSIPEINNSDVNSFTNYNKYPFVIGNCCLASKFNSGECFGEAWLRAKQKGAAAYIGGTCYTYWTEDFVWSVGAVSSTSNPNSINYDNSGQGAMDNLFHTHGEPQSDWASNAGALIFAGNMAVQTATASSGLGAGMKKYYWEIYNVLGDPSYEPCLKLPQEISVEHPTNLLTIDETLEIKTQPYAYVGFTLNGKLLAGGKADAAGVLTLPLPDEEELETGDAKLVVTLQHHIPYIVTIPILPADRPAIRVTEHELSVNENPIENCIFGKTMSLRFDLENPTDHDAQSTKIELITDTTWVKIIHPTTSNWVVSAHHSAWSSGYQLIVSPNIPDGYNLPITAKITYSDSLSTSYRFNLTASAPDFEVSKFTVNDENKGSFTITNKGSQTLENAQVQLTKITEEIAISNLTPTSATFALNTPVSFTFDLTNSQNHEDFYVFSLNLSIQQNQYAYQKQLNGAFGTLKDDFETEEFQELIWHTHEWEADSTNPYEGLFAVHSASVGHSETSDMTTFGFDLFGEDSIVFYYKVSSENCSASVGGAECGDALEFSMSEDSVTWNKVRAYYGEIPWTRAAFPVKSGIQYFRWRYAKDEMSSRGYDRAWIDHIVFPKMSNMPNVSSGVQTAVIPDHIAFDVIANNGTLHARINAETPAKATIRLFNMLGQNVAQIASNSTLHAGQNDFYFNISNLPKGTYICTYFDGNRTLSRKVVVN